MDDDTGGLGPRDWGCYYEQQPYKSTLGLQLMSSTGVDRETKNLLTNGAFIHHECGVLQQSMPMEFIGNGWMTHRDNKMVHMFPVSQPSYAMLPDALTTAHSLPMAQPPEQALDVKPVIIGDPGGKKGTTGKKRSRGPSSKTPKPKKPRKVPALKDEVGNGSASRGRAARKNVELVINGIGLDISGIATPVCSCTGAPQQCYRWGIGGWQSACCTTSMSEYPLPMSTKRRGARIAGRKMSQGAFKKVLEKLAGEGYDLSNPIDLRPFWAKHGTNKFVTIR